MKKEVIEVEAVDVEETENVEETKKDEGYWKIKKPAFLTKKKAKADKEAPKKNVIKKIGIGVGLAVLAAGAVFAAMAKKGAENQEDETIEVDDGDYVVYDNDDETCENSEPETVQETAEEVVN